MYLNKLNKYEKTFVQLRKTFTKVLGKTFLDFYWYI